jgi:hypothetical protein
MRTCPSVTDVSEAAEATVFNASHFQPTPAHWVEFIACGAKMRGREPTERYVIRGAVAVEVWCGTTWYFNALEGPGCDKCKHWDLWTLLGLRG